MGHAGDDDDAAAAAAAVAAAASPGKTRRPRRRLLIPSGTSPSMVSHPRLFLFPFLHKRHLRRIAWLSSACTRDGRLLFSGVGRRVLKAEVLSTLVAYDSAATQHHRFFYQSPRKDGGEFHEQKMK